MDSRDRDGGVRVVERAVNAWCCVFGNSFFVDIEMLYVATRRFDPVLGHVGDGIEGGMARRTVIALRGRQVSFSGKVPTDGSEQTSL